MINIWPSQRPATSVRRNNNKERRPALRTGRFTRVHLMRSESYGAIALFLLALAVVFQTSLYPLGNSLKRIGPGFFPMALGVLMALFSFMIFIKSIVHPAKEAGFKRPKSWSGLIVVVGSTLAFGFLLQYLGLFLTTFLFSFWLFKYAYPDRWWMPIGGGAATGIITFLVFKVWLGTSFPPGLMGF